MVFLKSNFYVGENFHVSEKEKENVLVIGSVIYALRTKTYATELKRSMVYIRLQ
jgi:hypothetical protein